MREPKRFEIGECYLLNTKPGWIHVGKVTELTPVFVRLEPAIWIESLEKSYTHIQHDHTVVQKCGVADRLDFTLTEIIQTMPVDAGVVDALALKAGKKQTTQLPPQ